MIFGLYTTCDFSNLSQISLAYRLVKLRHNNFEISLVIFMPNITTNHAITYTTTTTTTTGNNNNNNNNSNNRQNLG